MILNFSPNLYRAHRFGVLSKGTYHEVLNSEQDIWGGCHVVNEKAIKAEAVPYNQMAQSITVDVPPFGGVLLEVRKRKRSAAAKQVQKQTPKKQASKKQGKTNSDKSTQRK